MSRFDIKIQSARYRELHRRLLEADPELDASTLMDTLEGETDLHEAIEALVRSALEDEAYVSGLKGRMEELSARMDRLKHRVQVKRELALEVMEETGLKKIEACDFTVSLRQGAPKVLVTSQDDIPEWFFVPQPAKLDKRSLLDALKAGTSISGVELSNGAPSLSVRTR